VFYVMGYADGTSYTVQVGGDPVPSARNVGLASGSEAGLEVLREHEGEQVNVTPVGPVVVADYSTPEGVVAPLLAYTEVTAMDGEDVPDLLGASSPNVVH
jgi:hypothetical protein